MGIGKGAHPRPDWGELKMGMEAFRYSNLYSGLGVRDSPTGPGFLGPFICPL